MRWIKCCEHNRCPLLRAADTIEKLGGKNSGGKDR